MSQPAILKSSKKINNYAKSDETSDGGTTVQPLLKTWVSDEVSNSIINNNNTNFNSNNSNNINNNNVRYNPHDNNCGCSVRDVNKYDRLYCDCGDASSIEHNNIMNDNNIHYSQLSCNNDGSSLKYSDDNMRITNTKRNNIISDNSGDFYRLYDDDGCASTLYDDQDYLVACREINCRESIIYFTTYDDTAVYDAVHEAVFDTMYNIVHNTNGCFV